MAWRDRTWRRLVARAPKLGAWLGAGIFVALGLGMIVVMLVLLSELTKTWWSMAIATLVLFASLAPFLLLAEGVPEGLMRVTRRSNEQLNAIDREERLLEKAIEDGVPGRVSIAPEAGTEGALSTTAEPGALSKAGERKQTS